MSLSLLNVKKTTIASSHIVISLKCCIPFSLFLGGCGLHNVSLQYCKKRWQVSLVHHHFLYKLTCTKTVQHIGLQMYSARACTCKMEEVWILHIQVCLFIVWAKEIFLPCDTTDLLLKELSVNPESSQNKSGIPAETEVRKHEKSSQHHTSPLKCCLFLEWR